MAGSSGAAAEPLWAPSEERRRAAVISRYLDWLERDRGLAFRSYDELWAWSVRDIEAFWQSVWDFFGVVSHQRPTAVLSEHRMPGARWFPGATLNYAEHALRRRDDHPAVVAHVEGRPPRTLSYGELAREVGAVAAGLRRLGVGRGDRVAAYLPNIPETLVAFLAAASIGAVWSSCPPEFGVGAVADRFQQITPRVLFAVDGYVYGGKPQDRRGVLAELRERLGQQTTTVLLPYLDEQATVEGTLPWRELVAEPAEPQFTAVPFDHPLWILYSSGTTGLPKGLVHGHGGVLLEHYKTLALHCDLGPDDRFFWFSTTGWMMWNFLASGLLLGATLVLYDGNPGHPDLGTLWRLAEQAGITFFGTSAPFIAACMKAGVEPGRDQGLGDLRSIGSTGAPLSPEGFRWLYQHVKADCLVGSVSGGTDMCTAFVTCCPLLPVREGELQCRALGAKVQAYDDEGHPVTGEVGELVITEPMPSMPVFFWNDPEGTRYRESYFELFPGVWRHGDWIRIGAHGGCVISGRSDSTLNRGGVRMGTSDFYRVVEALPGIEDCLVIEVADDCGGESRLVLFVVVPPGRQLDDRLRSEITRAVRQQLSPRHVPDEVSVIAAVPRTLNGKKLEVPVKRILEGRPLGSTVNRAVIANPEALDAFLALADSGRS